MKCPRGELTLRGPPAQGQDLQDLFAAWTVWAKYGACSGCGARVRRSDLYEVGDHNLSFFEGDVLWEPCARDHGVL